MFEAAGAHVPIGVWTTPCHIPLDSQHVVEARASLAWICDVEQSPCFGLFAA